MYHYFFKHVNPNRFERNFYVVASDNDNAIRMAANIHLQKFNENFDSGKYLVYKQVISWELVLDV